MGILNLDGRHHPMPPFDPAHSIDPLDHDAVAELALEEWRCLVVGCRATADRRTFHPVRHTLFCVSGHPGSLSYALASVRRRVSGRRP